LAASQLALLEAVEFGAESVEAGLDPLRAHQLATLPRLGRQLTESVQTFRAEIPKKLCRHFDAQFLGRLPRRGQVQEPLGFGVAFCPNALTCDLPRSVLLVQRVDGLLQLRDGGGDLGAAGAPWKADWRHGTR
jgi:hypothetical protein